MFRKLSLLVIVASFVGIRAAESASANVQDAVTEGVKKASETPGIISRSMTAVRDFGSSSKEVVVTALTPSTYITAAKKAWNGFTWEKIKAAPGATVNAMYSNPGKTLLVAAVVAAAIAEYQTRIIRDTLFGTDDEEEDETKEGDVYFVGKKTRNQE